MKKEILGLMLVAGSTLMGCNSKPNSKEKCFDLPKNATMINDIMHRENGVTTHDLVYDLHDGCIMVLKHVDITKNYGCPVPAKQPKLGF
jgi:hypothetical protein